MIEVSLPSGQVAEFPDGTDPEVIRAAMAKLAGDISRGMSAPAAGHRDMSQLGADIRAAGGAPGIGAVAPPRDPGFMSEAAGALESSFGVPIAGAMEMLRDAGASHPIASRVVAGALGGAPGLAALDVAARTKPGITQEETADAAARRQAYLDAHPDDAHAALAFGTEVGAQVLPSLVPVAGAGDVAGSLARAAIPSAMRAAAPTAAEVLAGGASGAATGAGFGYVSSYGLTPEQRLQAAKTGALVGVAGGTLGGLASGIRARETAVRAAEAGANLPQEPPPAPPPDLAPLADRFLAERDQAAQAAQSAMPQLVEQARQYLAARQQFPNLPESARPPLVPDELLAAVRQQQGSPTAPAGLVDPATNAAAVRAVVERAQQAIDAKWHPIFENLAGQQPDPNVHAAADATQAAAAPEIQAPPYARAESPIEQRLRMASPVGQEATPTGPMPPPTSTYLGGQGAEAGFLQLGKNKPPANVDPFEAVVRHGDDPTAQQSGPGFLKRMGDQAYQEFVNAQQAPITLLRRAGLDDEAHQIELLQARSRGASAIAQGPLERGTYSFDPTTGNNTRTGDGFAAYLSGLDSGALKDVNDFMAAQHHMELAGRQQAAEAAAAAGAPSAQTMDAGLSINPEGTRLAQAKLDELQQRYSQTPGGIAQLQTIAEGVRDVARRAVLDPLREVGYLSDAQYDAIVSKGPHYAPFFRLIDDVARDTELQPGGTQSKPVKLISGGLDPDKPIAPPLDSFVMQAQRVGAWVERQRVRNQLADVADANPDTVGQEIYQARRGPMGLAPRDSYQVFRDGQRFNYTAPKAVLDAVNGLPARPASLLLQAAQVAARLKRAGVVVTPEFAAAHAVRFQFDATGFGSGETAGGKKFSYTPVDFFRGLMEMTPYGQKLGGYYDAWKQAGGAMAHINASDRALADATVQDIAGVGGLGGRILRNWQGEQNVFAKVLAPVLYPLEGTTRFLDTATRVGAFRKAKLAGASDLEAGAFSRDLLDYSRMGSVGRQVNGVHAFFNPDIQATDRFVRAMRDQPVATTLKGLSYMTLPAVANWYRWHNDPQYQNLPAWEKQVYLHLWKRDDGSFVRIPRPLGLLNLAFSYGVHNALDHLYGQDPDATHNLAVALTDLTPAHFVMKGGKFNPYDLMPSVLQPAVEAAAGEGGYSSFTDRPIVPQGLQGELPEDRQLDSTSAVAARVGGAMGIAPLKIDYLIQGYGGTAGRVATHLLDKPLGKQDLPPLPVQAHDLPLVGRFVDAPAVGWGSDPVSKFYALADSASQAAQSLKVAAEAGDARRYQQILKDHPEALLESTLSSTRADLAQLRKTRQQLRAMEGLTPQQRYDALLSIDQAATAMAGGVMHGAADYLRSAQ